jgi:pimeloyl-ACP methyl ester carboxylesterase
MKDFIRQICKTTILVGVIITSVIISCQQEEITFSKNANETFYVEHLDSKMRVQIRGNTLSEKIILTVHGGPGGSSYYLSYLDEMKNLERDFAIAYWDQPLAGGSQGNRVDFKVDDIAEGLRKVIATLKHRYGNSKKIILYSESWGGIITTAFLTRGNNQEMVSGWINSDGPHDFNLMDREIIKMAISIGEEQIAIKKNVGAWTNIVNYCKANDPKGNYAVSQKLNDLLGDAENLIDIVVKVNFETIDIFREEAKNNNAPFTALAFNLLSHGVNEVEKDAYTKDFVHSVSSIQTPLLLLWGKYDFIAPPAVADSLLRKVQSFNKKLVLLERSGHNGFLQEPEIYWPAMKKFLDEL